MGNHLGPFSEAPDWPEGQEQPIRAVGGQGHLRGVTRLPSKLETWFFFKPQVFGYGESFETISRSLRLTWSLRTACTGCRRSRRTSRSNSTSKHPKDLLLLIPSFSCYGKSFWTISIGLILTLRSRTTCMGCSRSWSTSWRNSISKQAKDLVFLNLGLGV